MSTDDPTSPPRDAVANTATRKQPITDHDRMLQEEVEGRLLALLRQHPRPSIRFAIHALGVRHYILQLAARALVERGLIVATKGRRPEGTLRLADNPEVTRGRAA